MFNITINGVNYPLNFGMKFLRDVDKRESMPIDGLEGITQTIGLKMMLIKILQGDIAALEDCIFMASRNQNPTLTIPAIDAWFEDPNTDIDGVFETIEDFLSRANATHRAFIDSQKIVEANKQ